MAVYSGTLATFGAQALVGVGVELRFVPNGPGVGETGIYSSDTVTAIPAGVYGAFEVELKNFENIRPLLWYEPRIVRLGGEEYGMPLIDFTGWKIFPTAGGGDIAPMIRTDANPLVWWASENELPSAPTGLHWFDPESGDILRKN